MIGIVSAGGHVPRYRLSARTLAADLRPVAPGTAEEILLGDGAGAARETAISPCCPTRPS